MEEIFMKQHALPLTPDCKARIKNRIKELDIRYATLAHTTPIELSRLKNIINPAKTKSIDLDTLNKLAERLDCTTDYLLCHTQNPREKLTTSGKPKTTTSPVNFDLRSKWIDNICDYLHTDVTTARHLHFVLCELPPDIRNKLLEGMNSIIEFVQNSTFYNLKLFSNSKNEKILQNNLSFFDEQFCTLSTNYSTAKKLYTQGNFADAVHIFLTIIYETINSGNKICIPLASEAHTHLLNSKNNQDIDISSELINSLDTIAKTEYTKMDSVFCDNFKRQIHKYFP